MPPPPEPIDHAANFIRLPAQGVRSRRLRARITCVARQQAPVAVMILRLLRSAAAASADTRSALHRCFKRYRVSRIPMGLAEIPPKFGLRGQSAHFTIEVCAMPGEAGDYLYAAINQTQFVFAKVMKGVTAALKTLREKTFLPSSTGAPHMRCV